MVKLVRTSVKTGVLWSKNFERKASKNSNLQTLVQPSRWSAMGRVFLSLCGVCDKNLSATPIKWIIIVLKFSDSNKISENKVVLCKQNKKDMGVKTCHCSKRQNFAAKYKDIRTLICRKMWDGVRHTSGGGATSKLRWRHLQLQVAPLLSSSGATSKFRWRHLQLQVAPLAASGGATSKFWWRHLKLQVAVPKSQVAVLKSQVAVPKFISTAIWELKWQLRFEFVDLFINSQG